MTWLLADGLRGYYDLRRHPMSDWLNAARAALAAARASGDPHAQATAFHGLAHVYYSLGRYPRAITYLTRTVALFEQTGAKQRQATLLSNLGGMLGLLGRSDEAIERLTDAAALQRQVGSVDGHTGVLLNLANAYRTSGPAPGRARPRDPGAGAVPGDTGIDLGRQVGSADHRHHR